MEINIGDVVTGDDVSAFREVTGTVEEILYPAGLGYYTDEPNNRPGRRYRLLVDAYRTAIVETPRPADEHGGPLQLSVDALLDLERAARLRRTPELDEDLKSQRRVVLDRARIGLKPGEVRTVTIPASVRPLASLDFTAKVFTVGTGQTRLDVRQGGELLNAFSRTDLHESTTLNYFASALRIALGF